MAALKLDHEKRGFDGIGYHKIVQPNGTVESGRPLEEKGAHVAGHNKGNIGVCLVGTDRFTLQQLWALRTCLDDLCRLQGVKKWHIWGHYQYDSAIAQGKTCPNMTIQDILGWYLYDSSALDGYLLCKSGS